MSADARFSVALKKQRLGAVLRYVLRGGAFCAGVCALLLVLLWWYLARTRPYEFRFSEFVQDQARVLIFVGGGQLVLGMVMSAIWELKATLHWALRSFLLLWVVCVFECLLLLASVAFFLWENTHARSDLEEYPRYVQALAPLNLIPNEIPADAENVKLFYLPKFMQGGGGFYLAMNRPADKLAEVVAAAKKRALFDYSSQSKINPVDPNLEPRSLHPKWVRSGNDYHIYIYYDRGFFKMSNHGEVYGIAIDGKRRELVYFYQVW